MKEHLQLGRVGEVPQKLASRRPAMGRPAGPRSGRQVFPVGPYVGDAHYALSASCRTQIKFVQSKESMTCNMHQATHLAESVRQLGPLWLQLFGGHNIQPFHLNLEMVHLNRL